MEIADELRDGLAALYAKLEHASVVESDAVPRNAVTLGSLVIYYDPRTETEQRGWLVLPWNGDLSAGRISVVSPLGVALIGSRIGMSLRYRPEPAADRVRRVDLIDIPFQPESSYATRD